MSDRFLVDFRDNATLEEKQGLLLNSVYCPVRDEWVLLISGQDGMFYTVKSNGVGVTCTWLPEGAVHIVHEDDDDGEFSD